MVFPKTHILCYYVVLSSASTTRSRISQAETLCARGGATLDLRYLRANLTGFGGNDSSENVAPRFQIYRTSSMIIHIYLLPCHPVYILPVHTMAPSFSNLTEDNGNYDSEEEIDFSGQRTAASHTQGSPG